MLFTPELATEVTLQPIRRYGFDAAILFSDILVIPDALDRDVRFEEGRGPLMTPIDAAGIAGLDGSNMLDAPGAGDRNGFAVAPCAAGGNNALGILRCALDGGDLHDCRAWNPGPGTGAAVCLSRAGGLRGIA